MGKGESLGWEKGRFMMGRGRGLWCGKGEGYGCEKGEGYGCEKGRVMVAMLISNPYSPFVSFPIYLHLFPIHHLLLKRFATAAACLTTSKRQLYQEC